MASERCDGPATFGYSGFSRDIRGLSEKAQQEAHRGGAFTSDLGMSGGAAEGDDG